jgi:hypothetical protein
MIIIFVKNIYVMSVLCKQHEMFTEYSSAHSSLKIIQSGSVSL